MTSAEMRDGFSTDANTFETYLHRLLQDDHRLVFAYTQGNEPEGSGQQDQSRKHQSFNFLQG